MGIEGPRDQEETDSKDRLPEQSSLEKAKSKVRIQRNLESEKGQLGERSVGHCSSDGEFFVLLSLL